MALRAVVAAVGLEVLVLQLAVTLGVFRGIRMSLRAVVVVVAGRGGAAGCLRAMVIG